MKDVRMHITKTEYTFKMQDLLHIITYLFDFSVQAKRTILPVL